MRRIQTLIVTLCLGLGVVACSSKHEGDSGSGSAGSAAAKASGPTTCPPGNVIAEARCVVAITPEKIAAIALQQSRIDELARLLDQIDTLGAPVELLDAFRQLDQWKALAAKSPKLAILDGIVAKLGTAVKQLRTFKDSLGEVSARLGNLKGELDRLMQSTGTTKKLEEVRSQISTQLRAALEPLAASVHDTVINAIQPLASQLSDTADLITGACVMAKLSGGTDKMKGLCDQAKQVFDKARTFVTGLEAKPVKLFNELVVQLEAQLDTLVDTETQKLIGTAQASVNDALRLPAEVAGSGASPH